MSEQPQNEISGEKKRLRITQTAVLMACLTIGSKLIGFVRELVLANAYGTSMVMDAYDMAQSIPGIVLGGILGAIGTAYTPIFSELTEKNDAEAGRRFTNQIATFTIFLASVVAILGIIFSDQLVQLFAGGFEPEKAALTSFYLKIVFIFSAVTSVLNISEAYLNYYDRFLQPILSGYLNSIALIAVAAFSAHTDHHFLVFGLLIGAALQLGGNLIAAGRIGYRYWIDWEVGSAIRRVFLLALPVFIGSSVSSINGMVDKMVAATLPDGSIAALGYAARICVVLILLPGSIISTIFYPKVTKAGNLGDWEGFSTATKKSFTVDLMLTLPISMGAVVFADEVIQVIFERGAFDISSTLLTAGAFRFYSFRIVFDALTILLTSVFNAVQEMKTPVICGICGIAVNITLDLLLVRPMQHEGLALASSVAALVQFAILMWFMKKKHAQWKIFPSLRKTSLIVMATVLAVLAAVFVYRIAALVWMPRMAYLGLAVIAAIVIYLLLLKLFRIEEVEILKELVGRG